MLRSMTGFGIAETETNKINIKVEVKSLNGKFFELILPDLSGIKKTNFQYTENMLFTKKKNGNC